MSHKKPKTKLRVVPWCLDCAHYHGKKFACAPLCAACEQHHTAAISCSDAGPDRDRLDRRWDGAVERERARRAADTSPRADWDAVLEEMRALDESYQRLRHLPVFVDAAAKGTSGVEPA